MVPTKRTNQPINERMRTRTANIPRTVLRLYDDSRRLPKSGKEWCVYIYIIYTHTHIYMYNICIYNTHIHIHIYNTTFFCLLSSPYFFLSFSLLFNSHERVSEARLLSLLLSTFLFFYFCCALVAIHTDSHTPIFFFLIFTYRFSATIALRI